MKNKNILTKKYLKINVIKIFEFTLSFRSTLFSKYNQDEHIFFLENPRQINNFSGKYSIDKYRKSQ